MSFKSLQFSSSEMEVIGLGLGSISEIYIPLREHIFTSLEEIIRAYQMNQKEEQAELWCIIYTE